MPFGMLQPVLSLIGRHFIRCWQMHLGLINVNVLFRVWKRVFTRILQANKCNIAYNCTNWQRVINHGQSVKPRTNEKKPIEQWEQDFKPWFHYQLDSLTTQQCCYPFKQAFFWPVTQFPPTFVGEGSRCGRLPCCLLLSFKFFHSSFFSLPFQRTYNFTTASGYKQYQPLRITDNTMEKTETTLRSPSQYSGRFKSCFITTPTH